MPDEGAKALLRELLDGLAEQFTERGIELSKVASGYRLQVRQEYSKWVSRLWEEKPPRYTRALLETLSLIAYKQPVTRGDIEEVRGVTVSTNIMRTLMERGWIREVGQREVPGRPSMYGTTKEFLDYFNLKSLDQLPTLAEVRALVEPVVVEETPTTDAGDTDAANADTANAAEDSAPDTETEDVVADTPDSDADGDADGYPEETPDSPEIDDLADAEDAATAEAGAESEAGAGSEADDPNAVLGEPEITITEPKVTADSEPKATADVVTLPNVAND